MSTARRPPIAGDVILAARLRKGMTQEQVQAECFKLGTKVNNLSRMENGDIKHPDPKVFPVLAAVLALEVDEMLVKAAA
jgi:transcriptional regulator with XRE-family HTH domain